MSDPKDLQVIEALRDTDAATNHAEKENSSV